MARWPTAAPPRTRRLVLALLGGAVAAAVVAAPARAATVDIAIAGLAFAPASAPMQLAGGEPGYTAPHVHVVWTMNDPGTEHTVTFDDPRLVSSERLATGQRYEVVLYSPGSFTYHCTIHPTMTGTLVVAAAAPDPPTSAVAAPASGAPSAPAPGEGSGGGASPLGLAAAAAAGVAVLVAVLALRRRRSPVATDPSEP